jgi:hypothetical protein
MERGSDKLVRFAKAPSRSLRQFNEYALDSGRETQRLVRPINPSGSGFFMAVTNSGTNRAAVSKKGKDWTAQTDIQSKLWSDVCYSPKLKLVCAVSLDGAVATSDGKTWTAQTPSAANQWSGIAWSPKLGIFCAVGQSGVQRVMTSDNGEDWTGHTFSAAGLRRVCWSPDLEIFVATVNSNRCYTSPDGIVWTQQNLPASNGWTDIAWSPKLNLFAMINQGTLAILTSPEGINWTSQTASGIASGTAGICWSPEKGIFCVVGNSASVTSDNGIDWDVQTIPAYIWTDVCWSPANGLFAAVARNSNKAASSPNAIDWTERTLPITGSGDGVKVCATG